MKYLIIIMLLMVGCIQAPSQEEVNKSLEKAQNSFNKVVDMQIAIKDALFELCSDPHNKKVCDKHGITLIPNVKK